MSEAVFENKETVSDKKKNHLLLWNFSAAAGFIGGSFLMVAGLILSAISYFDKINFHRLEVAVLVASIVLLMLGAHFLDLADKQIKQQKKERLNL